MLGLVDLYHEASSKVWPEFRCGGCLTCQGLHWASQGISLSSDLALACGSRSFLQGIFSK